MIVYLCDTCDRADIDEDGDLTFCSAFPVTEPYPPVISAALVKGKFPKVEECKCYRGCKT